MQITTNQHANNDNKQAHRLTHMKHMLHSHSYTVAQLLLTEIITGWKIPTLSRSWTHRYIPTVLYIVSTTCTCALYVKEGGGGIFRNFYYMSLQKSREETVLRNLWALHRLNNKNNYILTFQALASGVL